MFSIISILNAMATTIVAHVHNEIITGADPKISLEAICAHMGKTLT